MAQHVRRHLGGIDAGLPREVLQELGDPVVGEVALGAARREQPGRGDLDRPRALPTGRPPRSEEHTSELQSLMRISYAVFCLKIKNIHHTQSASYLHQTPACTYSIPTRDE